MDCVSIECPFCGARHGFFLAARKEQHLRQCPDCEHWLTAHMDPTDANRDYLVESLNHPPTCPIDSCAEVIDPEELAQHIIETHDGALL